ncbi:type 1 glutamine amidotransferase domain-containing protein [Micromonospora musae]|uniref:Type 1 glutamine amidotransferase domain-containing protein n=1 Tax=Micromonospora musae TaxID=1894970 RepID=A0A3A9Y591_9ACTN|nr:type 1 glutamine amidotransferase domain-containing protein [Micromonospora musae]RKN20995.1 type 1 glutamine amidotransferase domain-containing protein [Micromonospora musae]RKN32192.1 type 1 glutamine amidotransferase domain-containing protein [Micromonospora musae]
MSSVLIVLSGARFWTQKDGSQRPTGFWAEEFITPHRILTEAGVQVTIATPGGRVPVADAVSLTDESEKTYLAGLRDVLGSPLRLEDVDPADYDAVLVPGGHGPMQDLAVDPDIARILEAMLPDESKAVAALCHGLAAFLPAGNEDGSWLFRGRRMTSFTDAEEDQVGLAANAPWLLESRLRAAGAVFDGGPAFGSYVVVDGNLITGQNPQSAAAAGEALLKAITA